MKLMLKYICALVLIIVIAACGGGGNSGGSPQFYSCAGEIKPAVLVPVPAACVALQNGTAVSNPDAGNQNNCCRERFFDPFTQTFTSSYNRVGTPNSRNMICTLGLALYKCTD